MRFAILGASLILFGFGCAAAPDQQADAPEDVSPPLDLLVRNEKNMEPIAVDRWEHTGNAQRIINESQGRTTQPEQLEGSVVQHPSASEVFYVVTTATNKAQDELFMAVYQYNIKTVSWERLYKTTTELTNATPVLSVLGYENGRLIFSRHPYRGLKNNCESDWIASYGGAATWVTMSLKDPYGALESHVVPADIQTRERDRELECLQKLYD